MKNIPSIFKCLKANLHLGFCGIKPNQNVDNIKSMITKFLAMNCSHQSTQCLCIQRAKQLMCVV